MTVRVLWVIKGLGPGGAEHLLLAAAAAHDRSRFHIECAFVLPWKDHLVARLEAARVRCHCLSRTRSDVRWPLRLSQLVRSGDWDVVHVHSPAPGSVARLAARTMPRASRPGLVSTEHNRWETHRLPTRLANRLTSRWDAEAITVTDEVRESMQGPVAELAVTVRHGIDTAAVAAALEERSAARAEFGFGADEIVVGTVANFRPQKDYPNLLRAARLLADRDVPLRVLAVGQGPQEAEIRTLHDDLGLGDRVILTGVRDDAVRVMAACDVFTLASKWEGLPVAVMEACALGLPIVATAVGGLVEEFTDGVDALLVPPGDAERLADALAQVAEDPSLRSRLADASRAKAGSFDIANAVEALEAAYLRVAPDRPADAEDAPPARSPRRPALDIRPADPSDRDEVLALLRRSLGAGDDPRYPELFSWKHDQNAFGTSPMWVAVDGDRIAAFRTLMRWEFVRGGQVLRAVRAVDTATDPDYQGKGLFTALTLHGIEAVREEGVDMVFNTPNSQSRPGYLKMGWREVGKLPTAVRFIGPSGALTALRSKVPADRWSLPLTVGAPVAEWLDAGGAVPWLERWRSEPVDVRLVRTNLSEEFLRWRFATPLLGYRVVESDAAAIIVRSRQRGNATELAVVAAFGDPVQADRLATRTARDAGADYAIRLGAHRSSSAFAPLPGGGPVLTWRAVNDPGMPPLSNWGLSLGDVELF
jgi:glycosyltransferase involved in cell wall biosynthesis/GNAT superfamily N-acetyltransferase